MNENEDFKNQSLLNALWERIRKTASHFNKWTAWEATDSFSTKLLKSFAKVFGILMSIALSPFVILALALAFLAAI